MGVTRHVRRIAPRAWFYGKCLRYKFYNGAAEIGLVRHLVAGDKLALDVGCSIGIYAREMAKYATKVVAFEANPSVAAFARRVAPRNVEVVNLALSSAAGRMQLRIPVGRRDSTIDDLATIEPKNTLNCDRIIAHEVAAKPLDDFGFADCGFIKIDVEGHEEAVLEGGRRLIETQRPILMIELYDQFNPGITARVLERICRLAYAAYAPAAGGLRPITGLGSGGGSSDINFIFVPQEAKDRLSRLVSA
jgi:FkbM family methyltransferase